VLHVEIRDLCGDLWRLATQDAEWSPSDPAELLGRTIDDADIDEETGELRRKLSDGSLLDARPAAQEASDDPPNWELITPGGVVLEFGPGAPSGRLMQRGAARQPRLRGGVHVRQVDEHGVRQDLLHRHLVPARLTLQLFFHLGVQEDLEAAHGVARNSGLAAAEPGNPDGWPCRFQAPGVMKDRRLDPGVDVGPEAGLDAGPREFAKCDLHGCFLHVKANYPEVLKFLTPDEEFILTSPYAPSPELAVQLRRLERQFEIWTNIRH
jgi:hypothetical protein